VRAALGASRWRVLVMIIVGVVKLVRRAVRVDPATVLRSE
jgi:hypothetical protein